MLGYYIYNISSFNLILRIIIVRRQLYIMYLRKLLDDNFPIFIFATDLPPTDFRDFIYGILGVLNLPIYPDYEKSIKLVFIEISRVGSKWESSAIFWLFLACAKLRDVKGRNGAYGLGC